MSIEINGLANIHILIDSMSEEHGHNGQLDYADEQFSKVKKQLEMLERYMIAFAEATQKGEKPPYWHEVLANPKNFKLNKER